MDKEEAINSMIEGYKKGDQISFTNFCVKHECVECPFNQGCRDAVFNELIKRLLKLEEHQETNLEHWYNSFEYDIRSLWTNINLRKEAYSLYVESDADDMLDWLLSPYKETKPRYKLSKFEHDLLKCYSARQDCVRNRWELCRMQDKGYFKGIPTDIPIKDVLDNCEVINE